MTRVDGWMLSNVAITVFDCTDGQPGRWPTWGKKLSSRPASIQLDRAAGNDLELAASCLQTLLASWDRQHLDEQNVTGRTVFIDTELSARSTFSPHKPTPRRSRCARPRQRSAARQCRRPVDERELLDSESVAGH